MLDSDFCRKRASEETHHLQFFFLQGMLAAISKNELVGLEAELSRGPRLVEITDSDAAAIFIFVCRSLTMRHARASVL
jgi:hypothetical protein